MNERIKELAKQAGGEFYEGFAGSPNAVRFMETELEKFAELLLDEFIEALKESNGTHSETSEYGLSILIGDIRKHFGMEKNGG